ncbi:alpha/beta fold hydrolase [Actinokineospora bangkokensis]|uniref:Alpha/beta hydrolase n=1 Tax=Actinokineospora bangkokensis TaxID=1193682 RepID=A0A1Q9LR79_9PSEU|nr:alpha/beta hydrolase [Actinokineospora bangkokensis]OLR94522.1 alpha/beta hydrolase [Actinokineospora bangkokensis]
MTEVTERPGSFRFDGHALSYSEFTGAAAPGDPAGLVVLLHGQLMTRTMHRPLARALAAAGHRVVTLDLLGHGRSDRPAGSWRYSMTTWATQVVGLLDHLGVRRALIAGTSLGANVTLEVAVAAPERVVGMVVEMPVLDNAIVGGLAAFAPLLVTARFLPPVVRAVAWAADRVPRGHQWVDTVTETLHQEPAAMASVVHGIFFGRIAPPTTLRTAIDVPALVIGHQRDPIHPFGDAHMLAGELPRAKFVEARSPFELRFAPKRLTSVIERFIGERFAAERVAAAR